MREIGKSELQEILKKHHDWINGRDGGKRASLWEANLREANLREADLREANLRGANLRGASLLGADLREANLREADLRGADLLGANLRGASLREADLREANLREANLRGASLDYSVWPLWCGSLDVKVDARIAAQLLYHFCRLDCDDPAFLAVRNSAEVLAFANTFHRVEECGQLIPRQSLILGRS